MKTVTQSELLRAATEGLRNAKRIKQWRAKMNLNDCRVKFGLKPVNFTLKLEG